MSYILDALKKSEQERKIGNLPDLNSDHQLLIAPANEVGAFVKILLILLAVFIIIIGATFFFRNELLSYFSDHSELKQPVADQHSAQRKKPRQSVSTYTQQVQGAGEREGVRESEALELAEPEIIRPDPERRARLENDNAYEAKLDAKVKQEYETFFAKEQALSEAEKARLAAAAAVKQDATQAEASSSNPDNSSVQKGKTASAAETTTEAASEKIDSIETTEANKPAKMDYELDWHALPTIADLESAYKSTLPKLEVSTHIYSNAVDYRKVTVNGKNLRVGDSLTDDIRILAITDEGIVFQFKDVIFKMNALDEWKGMQ